MRVITFFSETKPTDLPDIKDIWIKVPAVTKVLQATQPQSKKDGLAKWRATVGEEEADRIVQESIQRGKAFDESIAKVKAGLCGVDYIDDYFKNKKIENLQMGFVCILGEKQIKGKTIALGYKGFIDFTLQDSVVDTKTWKKHKLDENGYKRADWVDRDYYLQVCAYSSALNMPKAMILGSDGNSFQEFPIYDIRSYYKEFESRLVNYLSQ